MNLSDYYKLCSLEEAEEFAKKRDYQKKVEEAPHHPGYEDAVITESKPVFCGIYKSKPLSDEEIKQMIVEHTHKRLLGERFAFLDFARAIEKAHGIK